MNLATQAYLYDRACKVMVNRVKREVLIDVAKGRVPITVQSFGALHSYVDANCYGGFGDERLDTLEDETMLLFVNEVQDTVDRWIKAGGVVASGIVPLKPEPVFITRQFKVTLTVDEASGEPNEEQIAECFDPILRGQPHGVYVRVEPICPTIPGHHMGDGCLAGLGPKLCPGCGQEHEGDCPAAPQPCGPKWCGILDCYTCRADGVLPD